MEYVKNPVRLKKIISEKGEFSVGGVSFAENRRDNLSETVAQAGVDAELLYGLVVFVPFHFNAVQEARWIEASGYERNPILAHNTISNCVHMYQKRHGFYLDENDWPTFLVCMALPYTKHTVTVIAPEHFTIHPKAMNEAKRRAISINYVPISYFPGNIIRRAERQYLIKTIDKEGRVYPDYAERLLNEKKDAFRDYLPKYYREYGEVQ